LRTALVIGSANTLADDYAAACELFTADMLIGCNHAARDHDGPLDHWATMHPNLWKLWVPERRAAGRPEAGAYWYPRHRAVDLVAKVPAKPDRPCRNSHAAE
jgi:hypothetical protein